MRRKLKRVMALILIILSIMVFPLNVYAADYYTYNNHVISGGVGNWGQHRRYYYITSSAVSDGDTTLIQNAMSSWIYTDDKLSTPISFRQTTTQKQSVMDIYAGNYYAPSTGIIAETLFYSSSGEINPMNSNWVWNKIDLNMQVFNTLSLFNMQGSIAHEMGHCMGLNENDHILNAIMCQLGNGRVVNEPEVFDLRGINYLY